MIPTYLEIEGASVDDVYHTLQVLGFEKEEAIAEDVQKVYSHYGYHLESISHLKLE